MLQNFRRGFRLVRRMCLGRDGRRKGKKGPMKVQEESRVGKKRKSK